MMIVFTALSDFFLYIVMAVLAGAITLRFIPESRRPAAWLSRRTEALLAAAIPVLGAAPVVQLTFLLAPEGYRLRGFMDITAGFRAGHSFLALSAAALILAAALRFGMNRTIQLLLILSAFGAIAYGSHSATIDEPGGLIAHGIHLTALSVWAGILFHAAAKPDTVPDWRGFLKWFTPAAAGLMAVMIVTGIFLMLLVMNAGDYASSWILPYGQMLLLKHLSIIPLLAAAAINGFIAKKDRPPSGWLRTESFMLLLVLFFTAVMSKLSPPHDIDSTFRSEGSAPLAEWLSGPPAMPIDARLDLSLEGLLFLVISLLLLALFFIGSRRDLPKWLPAFSGIGFVIAAYLGLMMITSF
ncbi:copper resistance D family protein [Bhargavaea massiliensis]|uniref:copper resistance D family protein n=1 Tax=Bhargavaea massiliensis TaxID=2697500 RepID=UPI001BCFA2E5|nr:CopD family protein [Bhargavaea massiliensis]